ncbi:Pyridoxine kinase [Fasciola gigantica]|uniref:Pyridoxal kinase n=1 Tax=Fasciola gigantica TaxID=46835 RepID=A0A504YJM9_FASGI|nr:Pyridoxine kinase [Fasciola gigantica]
MTYRVLSIQSHVVHGYVGNRSAVFPLQVLGIEVDFVNSVQLSNHTGYHTVKGQVLNAEDLKTLYKGLKANGLHQYTHVLTGYVGSASFLEAVAELVEDMKNDNPDLRYYCDPVLGDSGELYVPAELIPIYREKILPLADVILPNQFEAELLSECKIVDEKSALLCIRQIHLKFHVPTVILSSTDIVCSVNSRGSGPDESQDLMLGYASSHASSRQHSGDSQPTRPDEGQLNSPNSDELFDQVRFRIPILDGDFRGTGDLFAALTLAHLESERKKHKSINSIVVSVKCLPLILYPSFNRRELP